MFRNGAVVALSVLVFGRAALVPDSCLAQSQDQSVPNLSGAWELVEDDNDAVKLKPTHAGFPRLTLVISHEGSLIRVTHKQIRRGTETVQEYSYTRMAAARQTWDVSNCGRATSPNSSP